MIEQLKTAGIDEPMAVRAEPILARAVATGLPLAGLIQLVVEYGAAAIKIIEFVVEYGTVAITVIKRVLALIPGADVPPTPAPTPEVPAPDSPFLPG